MIQTESWGDYCKNIPLVACVGLVDEWMTIYACLQNACEIFDHVVVVGDNATPRAINYLNKYKSDYHSNSKKVEFIELGQVDPWPWLRCPRPGVDYKDILEIPSSSWAKAMNKRFNYVRSKYPNSMVVSVHSDVIMFLNSRERMIKRFCDMKNPFLDSEWFCMSYMADFDHITGPCVKLEDGTRIGAKDLNQRAWYDYPGDWGLAGCYASSLLTVGPDPISTFAECFYPWSRETQCEKKGHDTNPPYAAHMGWWKDSYANWKLDVFENTVTIDSLKDPYIRNEDVRRCYFPDHLVLSEDGYFRYNSELTK